MISKLYRSPEASFRILQVVWMFQTFPMRGTATTAPQDSGRTPGIFDEFAKLCVGGQNPFGKAKTSQGAPKPFPGKPGIEAFEYVDAAGREMIELDHIVSQEEDAEPDRKAIPKEIVSRTIAAFHREFR